MNKNYISLSFLSLLLFTSCNTTPGTTITSADVSTNRLVTGPRSPGEHGPLSASDYDKDGIVSRSEIEQFMGEGPYRRTGLVAFFEQSDSDQNQLIDAAELAGVQPPYAFDGTDANADGIVSKTEVENYVSDPTRLYRKIGLEAFFDLLDTDQNNELSPAEIEAAHESGQLARG